MSSAVRAQTGANTAAVAAVRAVRAAQRSRPPGRPRHDAVQQAFARLYPQLQARWQQRGAPQPPTVTAVLAALAQQGVVLPRATFYLYCQRLGLPLPRHWRVGVRHETA